MSGWSGRVDLPEGPATRRWHQWVREPVAGAAPGVALLGFASDEGVRRNGGRTGAAEGPAALRTMLSNLPLLDDTPLYDAGTVDVVGGDLEGAQQRYAERLAALLDAGHLPVGLGGGHEIAFATYQGLAKHLGERRPRVAIVNIDAHFDLRRQDRGSSGTPFLQAIEHARALGLPLDYCVYGISASANTRVLFDTADELGVHYVRDDELGLLDLPARIAELQARLAHVDVVYQTICLDALPHAVAPGVSAPSARGVPLEVVEPLLDAIAATGKVKVLDVAELSPPHDRDHVTARVAARLIHRVTHAVRRQQAA
ncbi:arginase/agmatinase/formimionoglutamate hydrolase [Dorcoceras hygrometricum]|uniref:Arginase/agmatinase/formimionoglutamate hydrolase n=1 Tax=Dorcoceras hygrometricum TaxID=472368 RepID=A0A2Z7A8B9_9LAMI|nr:arginase/agmatinase/formimionoglutamate hydrolase [Dorcoceras hygrometricum]